MLGLSTLGFVHTAISLLAVLAALILFLWRGRIVPESRLGQFYIVATALGCLTALGLSKHGGFNPGHALAILTLLCLVVGVALARRRVKGRLTGWAYLEVVFLSLSLLLSLIPAVNETLTRLPVGAPLASGPADPLVVHSLMALLSIFVVIIVAQLLYLRRARGAGGK